MLEVCTKLFCMFAPFGLCEFYFLVKIKLKKDVQIHTFCVKYFHVTAEVATSRQPQIKIGAKTKRLRKKKRSSLAIAQQQCLNTDV